MFSFFQSYSLAVDVFSISPFHLADCLSLLHSVMFLQFLPKTHLFFTAGKDKKIKQWDADKFQLVQTLEVTLCS